MSHLNQLQVPPAWIATGQLALFCVKITTALADIIPAQGGPTSAINLSVLSLGDFNQI